MLFLSEILLLALIIPIFIHKSFLIKILLIIAYYPLLVIFLFKNGVPMPGILELNRNDFSENILNYAFISYTIGLLIFNFTLYPLRNQLYNFSPIKISQKTRFILLLLAYLSSIPLLNTHENGGITKSATPYLVLNTLLLVTLKKRDFIWWGQLFLSLFLLANGERVDSLLIVIFMFIMKIEKINTEITQRLKLYIGCIFFFFFLIIIGFTRNNHSFTIDVLLKAIYSQQTVADVVQIYLSGVSYFFDYGSNTNVLYNLFGGIIPGKTSGVTSEFYYGKILNNYMPNAGGGLFMTEGMLLAGWLGTIVYFYIYAHIFIYLFNHKKDTYKALFILFFIMQCRLFWYGLIYSYKPILLIVVFFLIIKTLKKNYGTCKKYNHNK